ncbi:MAG: hypothetical protein JWO91_2818 [Acidobacteriaceae bacterium]|nr:hypothetical protein [Acidobacteriaceae bacterium]
MAGLLIDNFFPRLISARTHGVVDYIHASTNFVAALVFSRSDKRGSNAALALGISVLVNALMTDYPLGVFRVYSFKTHGMLDYGVAATSAAFPKLLGIRDPMQRRYFHAQGAGETLIAGLSDYDDSGWGRRRQKMGRVFDGRRAA